MTTFTIGEQDFLLDGAPFRILSGALHYFRIHPDQWADRIAMAARMGLNTIETYVAWNAHAPSPQDWDVTGGLDLGRFLDLVAAQGMYAIVRPGPYICAEWDGGGLPGWLFRDPAVGIRTAEPRYLEAVGRYLEQVADIVAPRQVDRGGPVILVQVENEYGAFGDDAGYLQTLTDLTKSVGFTVPLVTVDQPEDAMLAAGSPPGLLRTGSFGSRSRERLAALRRHQPHGPLMAMEFWVGWFDHWTGEHHTTGYRDAAEDLAVLLAAGASVNIYMLCGGTNFELTSGANDKGVYEPTITSYDYDAPLDEAGRPTAKFWALREVLARYAPVPEPPAAVAPAAPALTGAFETAAPLWADWPAEQHWPRYERVPTMDDLGRFSGLLAYRVGLPPGGAASLQFGEVRDRAYVFGDGVPLGVLAREAGDRTVTVPAGTSELVVLVEDQGRVNYGPRLGEPKGLIGPALLDGRELTGWCAAPVDLDRRGSGAGEWARERSGAGAVRPGVPLWRRGRLSAPQAGTDLYLDTASWGKGMAWCNGFALGRFWNRGPQRTLYVPGPVVRAGDNEIVVLDLEPPAAADLCTLPDAVLDRDQARL